MARSLVLGNGNILVCADGNAQVRDFYFPYVGLENHVGHGFTHRIGVWVDGTLHWLGGPEWHVTVDSEPDALMGNTTARNNVLGVTLTISDVVYNEKNIFLRKFTVKNTSTEKRTIKVYLNHEFELYEASHGDTAYFDPVDHTIIHYSGKRVFLVNGESEKQRFDDYTTGVFHINGKEGSYKDAEDGMLARNAIEHGVADSVIGFYAEYEPEEEKKIDYWIAAAYSIPEAQKLNKYVLSRSADHLIRTTHDYWHAWVTKESFNFHDLDESVVSEFRASLFMLRAHSDNHGAIIASGDSGMLQGGKDTYAYMWPRDGAFSAIALDDAGEFNVAQKFFRFCNELLTDDGYFMHKYRPDGSLGSSWHPWLRNGRIELPIQEDETALVIHALWNHYEKSHDLEFIERVYNGFIKKAADFMVSFRDGRTGLPRPSYDLWEEKFGISTFTASSVYAGLMAAAHFSKLLGKNRTANQYYDVAEKIRDAIMTYLYNEESGLFYKMINSEGVATTVNQQPDTTVDISSAYGVFRFGVLDSDDPRLVSAMKKTQKRLSCNTRIGGIARYEGDTYFRVSDAVPGNPWVITTLWLVQYHIQNARSREDFTMIRGWLAWVVDHAQRTGILSEQINPHTGEQISAAPLTWSHAVFVQTVLQYLTRVEELNMCTKCNPIESGRKIEEP